METIRDTIYPLKKEAKYRLRRGMNAVVGLIRGNRVNAYWYDMLNFGDLITPLLLRHYGMTPVHVEPSKADIVATGSILQVIPQDFSGLIAGAGLIHDEEYPLPEAKILGVRGKLTAERVGAPENVTLGDPGLLASELLPSRQEKQYTLGLVPHYVDKQDKRLYALEDCYDREVKVIDVQQKPTSVFKEIDRCKNIISSSLHGIITADSLHIPNAWVELSDDVLGGGFKFRDYNSAFSFKQKPIEIRGDENLSDIVSETEGKSGVETLKKGMDDIFSTISSHM